MKKKSQFRVYSQILVFVWLNVGHGSAIEVPQTLESLGDLEHLDLVQYRTSRQFKQAASSNQDGVAVGLIDALQRWADALEAQISLMRKEVISIKASNKRLKTEVDDTLDENKALKNQVSALAKDLADTREALNKSEGNMAKESSTVNTKVEVMRTDLQVFSKSFSDFLQHYQDHADQTKANVTSLSKRMNALKGSVQELSSSSGDISGEVKASLETMTNSIAVLTQTDYILQDRLKQTENMTQAFASEIGTEIMKLRTTIISPTFFNDAIGNLSREINNAKVENEMNITTLSFSVKALEQNIKLLLLNTTEETEENIMTIKDAIKQIRQEIKLQSDAFATDFVSVRKSVDFAKGKYDELSIFADTINLKLRHNIEVRNNFTTVVLLAMNDLGSRIEVSEEALAELQPQLVAFNKSLSNLMGQVGTEILRLQDTNSVLQTRLGLLNDTMTEHQDATVVNSNVTIGLSEKISGLETKLHMVEGNATLLSIKTQQSERNYTIIVRGITSLEKHFIDMKQDMFSTKLNVGVINNTVSNLGLVTESLGAMQDDMDNVTQTIKTKLVEMADHSNEVKGEMTILWNTTAVISTKLQEMVQNVTHLQGRVTQETDKNALTNSRQNKRMDKFGNTTSALEIGLTGLMNYSVEVQANISRLLVFAAENKAEILELKVANSGLEAQMGTLNDLHDIHNDKVTEHAGLTEANITRLNGLAGALETELDVMTQRYQTLESLFANYAQTAGDLGEDVQKIQDEQMETRNSIETMKFDLSKVEAGTAGVDVFISSIQGHISMLTSNVTSLNGNFTATKEELRIAQTRMGAMGSMLDDISENVTDNRNAIVLAGDEIDTLKLNSSTLKANIIGLGNYINNVNGDVNKLANSFERYISELKTEVVNMTTNLTNLEETVTTENAAFRNSLQNIENINANLKGEIATLTTKTYTMKTTLFEHQNDISALKADQENIGTDMANLELKMEEVRKGESSQEKEVNAITTDMSAIRTGLTSLTNSLFNLKAQIVDQDSLDTRLGSLSTNITDMSRDIQKCKSEIGEVRPDVESLASDLVTFRSTVTLLASDVGGQRDPPRFSCSVTSDEIRVSGVILYNICNVNTNDFMNRETGHATIKDSGDYFLSFTANMVSVNSQAVWCALYKQSSGNEGWQVLGMINNYQKNGENMADRDTGSMTLITSLKAGDQVWVEWRGYGESFLYSNPYRLISFTGFMLKKN
ncbi:hypothetical protein TCAL_15045 [Tigriopus californicus]|uniref:C1q domain-containing protein n=1 Tax=Tigriopus californicus TaxID=6832 RepID=A0A553NYZ0_TIGCA|nr:centrosomal protein of 290 kDa-like [Tigriopus californicus]TRY70641.1 hypothetical protein TCAL_15045 [Tigriopus californicus]